MPANTASFRSLLSSVKAAGEDHEFYPTTERMVAVVSRHIATTAKSILDIGAGDGRVLTQLAVRCKGRSELYAIEISNVLIEAQPENVIPVGTNLFEQDLTALPVDYLFSNPPYSEFEAWACAIIESGHARKGFLILPQRWKENPMIAEALKKRGARARVIGSDDFHDGARSARAVVDIIEISYPMKENRWEEVKDPFDIWFDQNISTFDAAEEVGGYQSEYELTQRELARVRSAANTIGEMVAAYGEEYARMEKNYRAIFQLDYSLLKELGVNKENVRDGLKMKMAGLKSHYWTVLFERLEAITNRLSTATKTAFKERLVGRVAQAFTTNNAYAVVLWAIKNANKYFDQQTVSLYLDLSTFDGVMNYKSNQRTWKREDWRYSRRYHLEEEETRPERYALDYRIVIEKWHAIGGGYDYPGGLATGCHELIADVIAVLFNLGFPALGRRSTDIEWSSGQWRDWYRAGQPGVILFQVKAFKNGNLHFRFLPEAMRALNVVAGRLLGWLRSASDVESELGYEEQEASRFFSLTQAISPSIARRLLMAATDSE